jgi:hypothetical protein
MMGVFISKEEKDIWESFNLDWMKDLMWGMKKDSEPVEEIFPIAYIEVAGREIAAAVSKDQKRAFALGSLYSKTDTEILTFIFKRWFRGMDF